MGNIFGAAGQVAGAAIQANAVKEAANIQAKALKAARDFVYTNLEPGKVAGEATAQDIINQQQRIALQSQLDPALSAARFQTQNRILQQAGDIGTGAEQAIGQQAASELMASGPQAMDLKNRLIDAALMELDAGATLPPDVQAELVATGLEKAGMVTGQARAKGFGGQLVRKEIGQGAIKLQADRQARAAALAQTASGLESARQSALQSLFPNLTAQKINQLGAQQSVLQQSAGMLPEAGLTGSDIANLWLARVGATSQLNQQIGNVKAGGVMGTAQAWAPGLGAAGSALGGAIPSIYNSVSGWFSPSATSSAPTGSSMEWR